MAHQNAARDNDHRLHVLVADYVAQRDDERSYLTILAALFAIAVPLVIASSSVVLRSCGETVVSFQSASTSVASGKGSGSSPGQGSTSGAGGNLKTNAGGKLTSSNTCSDLPRWAFSFIPFLPLAMLAFVTYLICIAAVRHAYTRSLERELRVRADVELEVGGVQLRGPSFSHLTAPLLRGVRGVRLVAVLWPVIYLAVYGATVGITVVSIVLTEPMWLRVLATLVYSACGVAITRIAFDAAFRKEALVERMALTAQP